MPHPRISLCMIVKDEADHLQRCLQSVKAVVDEMIVVDTGSSDETPDIARAFGAHVIDFPWKNDFAMARNVGLDAATGQWILFLDADETLDEEDQEKLLLCAQHTEYDGFFMNIHNVVGDGNQGTSINPVLRMFRRAKEHRFEGRIHEQIAASICRHKPDAAFHMSQVKIHHDGYRDSVITKKNKVNRNLQLLLKTQEETPDDPFLLYNLGVEYLRIGQTEQALQAFHKARAGISPEVSYAHLLVKCEARCLQALGRTDEAIELCAEGLVQYPAYTDLLHIKGSCEMALGRMEAAKASLFKAYQLGPAPEGFHTEEGVGTYQTCYTLGLLHETLCDYSVAADWYLAALRAKPSLNPPLCRLFRYMKCRGLEHELYTIILHRLNIRSPEPIRKILTLLLETGCYHTVSLLIQKWKPRLPEELPAQVTITRKLLGGDVKGAQRLLRRLRSTPQNKRTVEQMKGWVDWLRSKEEVQSFPERVPSEELPFAVRIASAAGKNPLPILETWKRLLDVREPWNALEAKRLIRTAIHLADTRLDYWKGAPEQAGLIRASRLAAPFEDGFS
ncbi:glycosyltransferase [Paenibacillus sp. FSL M7-1455]|jgi:Glycosyltransferases involved in cell wall biogenesis|uniref:glycosyltransferase n=1 Tax=Paenibacillus TaxID=44249 RepID=UPI00203CE757|nr:TPR domain-containing glycosyltransferase [Paenibacillus lactis]MCM3494625.1 glycosyltransferase [Paenibacillus lactis]